jgi:hypothetical protein
MGREGDSKIYIYRHTESQRHRDTETQRHRDTETQRRQGVAPASSAPLPLLLCPSAPLPLCSFAPPLVCFIMHYTVTYSTICHYPLSHRETAPCPAPSPSLHPSPSLSTPLSSSLYPLLSLSPLFSLGDALSSQIQVLQIDAARHLLHAPSHLHHEGRSLSRSQTVTQRSLEQHPETT